MSKVFLIMRQLNWGAGSTRAMMNRSRSMIERGYDVTILTFRDSNTQKIQKDLIKAGRMDERIKALNIYDYYRNENTISNITKEQKKAYKKSAKIYEKGYQVKVNEKKGIARYFNNGLYVKRKQWRKNKSLSYINYYNEKRKKILCEKFHEEGFITKKTYFDSITGKKTYAQYFTRDGFCFLDRWYSTEDKQERYLLFNRRSQSINSFNNKQEFRTHWLNALSKKEKIKPYVINDKKECAPIVMNMEAEIAYRIYVIHRNHFESPYILGSPYRKQEEKILENIQHLDKIVVLTEKQKQDIIKEFNNYNNISVIPHSIHRPAKEIVKKESKTVSMLARLAPIKQIPYAIEAFQIVVKEIPDAKLEIYGKGNLEESLIKRIKELNLEKNVFLKGYANNTDAVYKKSLFTLLTSKSEAFAMVVLESMVNGTPVISHDINYGPSDMITDKEDGYLIKQDKEILADKMIELLNNPKKACKMGRKAKRKVRRKYNDKKISDKWVHLLNELKEKK